MKYYNLFATSPTPFLHLIWIPEKEIQGQYGPRFGNAACDQAMSQRQ
jgi:hypothetical protein